MIRASYLPRYLACSMSRTFDQMADEGRLTDQRKFDNSPYAALGTCIHWSIQQGMGCEFPHDPEPPTDEDRRLARELVKDEEAAGAKALKLVRPILDSLAPGVWKAECEEKCSRRKISGHADLMSEDGTVLVDIKTTARRPTKARPKASNLPQMFQYKELFPDLQRAYLLYVHSIEQKWAILSPALEFDSPALRVYASMIRTRREEMQAPGFRGVPNLSACDEYFCPWRNICRDEVVPGPGTEYTAPEEPEPAMDMQVPW